MRCPQPLIRRSTATSLPMTLEMSIGHRSENQLCVVHNP
jgi:hypothetical protein